MPEISRFYGIVVMLYYADHDPPHFHARYQEHESVVRIADGEVLHGWLPDRATRLVAEWAALHRDALVADWSLARAGRPLLTIPPLP